MFYKPRHARPSQTRRRALVLASSGAVVTALLASPAVANAAPLQQLSGSIDLDLTADLNSLEAEIRQAINIDDAGAHDFAWDTRNNLHRQAEHLPQQAVGPVKAAIDNAVNAVFPGLIAARSTPPPAAAPAPAPAPAPGFNTGSCPPTADVCVDLDGNRSWLQENGQVSYGAVPISAGGIGQETPRGTFTVNRKVIDEVSWEFNNAPMPYAIYFTNNGHAFHEGNVATTSAGCVRLNHNDAVHYYENLQIGDTVHIY